MTRSVTAIIPAFRAEATIGTALRSVLEQTVPPDEVIVVDDGSPDGTADTARRFAATHPRGGTVRVLRQENAGASAARNAGLEAAGGEWIAFLDADDVWLPRRIESQFAVLDRSPGLRWVAGALRERPVSGRERILRLSRRGRAELRDGCRFDNLFAVLHQHCNISTICLLIHRSCFDEAGAFDPALIRREDVDLWVRIGLRHPSLGWVDEPVAEYVRRRGSLTKTYPAMNALEKLRHLRSRAGEVPGGEPVCRPYGEWLARQGCRIWLHQGDRAAIRAARREFPEWIPPSWQGPLRALDAAPGFVLAGVSSLLRLRLRLLGRRRPVRPS